MNTQTIGAHAIGVMKYCILMFHGTKGDALEIMQTVPIADVWQDPFKAL